MPQQEEGEDRVSAEGSFQLLSVLEKRTELEGFCKVLLSGVSPDEVK